MHLKVAVIYNQPETSRYDDVGETRAVLAVLDQAEAVSQALGELGHSVLRVPLRPPMSAVTQVLRNVEADLFFNLFEGFEGTPHTEATVAQMLCELDKPFTGNSPTTLALALDKEECKAILEAAGIVVPKYQVLDPSTVSQFHLRYPCIIKPCAEDASHGLSAESVVYDHMALERQIDKISKLYGGKALVEEFLEGREFNITVLGSGEVFPISEIVYSLPPGMPRILTFAAKWHPDDVYFDGAKAHCPADISDVDREYIVSTARLAFKALGCRGYARVDIRLDGEGELNVLEVNPNPDVSSHTGAALQAEAGGISYNDFIRKIMNIALEDHRKCR